jgi:hypothetical protein
LNSQSAIQTTTYTSQQCTTGATVSGTTWADGFCEVGAGISAQYQTAVNSTTYQQLFEVSSLCVGISWLIRF